MRPDRSVDSETLRQGDLPSEHRGYVQIASAAERTRRSRVRVRRLTLHRLVPGVGHAYWREFARAG